VSNDKLMSSPIASNISDDGSVKNGKTPEMQMDFVNNIRLM